MRRLGTLGWRQTGKEEATGKDREDHTDLNTRGEVNKTQVKGSRRRRGRDQKEAVRSVT